VKFKAVLADDALIKILNAQFLREEPSLHATDSSAEEDSGENDKTEARGHND